MSETGAQPHTSSPGARLALARKEAGLSASEVAERLHLDLRTLEALESGQFHGLGASVFVRGHLRHYADLLRVPEAEIMAAYDAWSGRLAAQPDLREVITAPAARSNARGVQLHPGAALIGAVVLVPVALIWWAVRMPAADRHAANVPAASAAAAPAALAVQAPLLPKVTAVAAPAALPVATNAKLAKPVAASATPTTASTAVVAAEAAPAPLVPAAAVAVHLALTFSQNSWAEVNDASGMKLYHGLALADSLHRVAGSAPLRVFLGNPMGVTLELDGHPVQLTGNSTTRPRHFSIDSSGRVVDVGVATPRSD